MTGRRRLTAQDLMSEAAFQRAVVDLAHLRGWMVFHVHDSRRGLGAGYPDLTMLHAATGRLLFAELKTAAGRVSIEQQEWIGTLQRGLAHDRPELARAFGWIVSVHADPAAVPLMLRGDRWVLLGAGYTDTAAP